ncbi:hypothetical protein [Dialister hominis]|uniref:hypothetical protein n=1 Tax=Dialister hominis TaxID=2582419 RepID=UPI003FF08BDD
MELYESLKVVGAAMIGLFGFLASLDKMVDLWKKYKGLAEAPDKAQNEEIKKLKADVELLKTRMMSVQDALGRDLHRFNDIDALILLVLDGVQNLLEAQLSGNNHDGMETCRQNILKYLMKGATKHGDSSE